MELKISMASARVNADLTQSEVAEKMGVSKQTIVNWEKGRIIPKPAQFAMFCDVCGISSINVLCPGS